MCLGRPCLTCNANRSPAFLSRQHPMLMLTETRRSMRNSWASTASNRPALTIRGASAWTQGSRIILITLRSASRISCSPSPHRGSWNLGSTPRMKCIFYNVNEGIFFIHSARFVHPNCKKFTNITSAMVKFNPSKNAETPPERTSVRESFKLFP